MLRVSNIAHLPTKPNQIAKARRLERKPKQPSTRLQLGQTQISKQNKEVKNTLMAELQQN